MCLAGGSCRGHPCPAILLGIAGWMRYAAGQDERGEAIDVRDPLAARFAAIASAAGDDPAALVDGFMRIESIFGGDLPARDDLRRALTASLGTLLSHGAHETLAHFLNWSPNAEASNQRSGA